MEGEMIYQWEGACVVVALPKHMLGPLRDQTTSNCLNACVLGLASSCIKEFVTSTTHYKEHRMNDLMMVKEIYTLFYKS